MAETLAICANDKDIQDNTSNDAMSNSQSLLDTHIYLPKKPGNSNEQQKQPSNKRLNSLSTSLPYILKSDDDFMGSCLNVVCSQTPPEDTQEPELGTTFTVDSRSLTSEKATNFPSNDHENNKTPTLPLKITSTKRIVGGIKLHNNNNDSPLQQHFITPPSSPEEEDNIMISPPPSAKSLTAEFNTFGCGSVNRRLPSIKKSHEPTLQKSKQLALAPCTTNSAGSSKGDQLSIQEQVLPPLPHQKLQPSSASPEYRHLQRLPPLPGHQHHQQQCLPPLPEHHETQDGCKSNSANSSSSSFTTVGTCSSNVLNTPAKDIVGIDLGNLKQYPSPLHIVTNNANNIGFTCDSNYHPDSSLLAASMTEPAPHPLSLAPHHPQFPPATLDNLNNFRRETQASPHDLALQLNFAKYLMEAVQQVQIDDVERSTRAKTAMLSEAQRIIKTLAMQSRMGRSGYADAQFYLANAYGGGLMLLNVSHEKAFNLYLQGSKQCHPECTYRAGVCYELGLGTRRDNARAMRFYRKAANLGDPSAMYKLAMILLRGLLGQSKHPKEAISWLKRAAPLADAYHPEILHELGLLYETDSIPSVIPDQDYTRELVTKAARFGYAPSQYKLGLAYENGMWNCPIDARRSIAWYAKAAEQGHMESALALSGWYLTGAIGLNGVDLLPQNDIEAYLWARKAADTGYAKGQYACGYYSETGIGVEQNLLDALKWYELAARQNYAKAVDRLAELKLSNINTKRHRKKQQHRLSLQTSQSYLAKHEDVLRRNSTLTSTRLSLDQQRHRTCPPNTPQVLDATATSKTRPSSEQTGSCQIM